MIANLVRYRIFRSIATTGPRNQSDLTGAQQVGLGTAMSLSNSGLMA